MKLLSTILKRPIQNIKTIDFPAIAWVFFWMGALVLLFIPVQLYTNIDDLFSLLFSFNFLEKIEVTNNENLYNASRINSLNQLYTAVNVSKVFFWSMTLVFVVRFLFKKPNYFQNDSSL